MRPPPSSGAARKAWTSLDKIVVWAALMDIDFEVHDPPELAERIGAMAAPL
ncbi:hypothetical protein ACFQY7_15420 [Actinomadura luteofluorescens]|uniref:WYL domain-containing protein n=1 Tax=Actinomadura luteofluorescens TaxID=46163 RepID=A0A7Y9JK40_9ACTN|nr:hypothetical protein [Actinomadura luteofluorescens]NYD52162.1 hypothetical protein [Actinomadura luteofluorescens]